MISKRSRGRQRKSPFKHHVRGHIRSGVRVIPYERGKGFRPRQSKRIRRKPSIAAELKTNFRIFNVTIKFVKSSSERLSNVTASTFGIALSKGLFQRKKLDGVKSVLVVRKVI